MRLAMGTAAALGLARFSHGLLVPAMRTELGWTLAEAGIQTTANGLGYPASRFGGFVSTLACLPVSQGST